MQSDDTMPGEDKGPAKGSRQRPQSAAETELNQALDRLDHQVESTKSYLASLDKEAGPTTAVRRRRKGDPKADPKSDAKPVR
jgi:hypothetical protein